jgi:type IV conjugative transfer system coupling protein TraD
MFSSFITGSQTEAHKFRMFKEAVKFLIRIFFTSSIISISIAFYKIKSYDLKVWFYYHQASLMKDLSKSETISIINNTGKKVIVPIRYVLTNKDALKVKKQVDSDIIYALKLGLVLPIFLPFWFWYQGKRRSRNKILRGITISSPKIVSKLISKYNDKILQRKLWKILVFIKKIRSKIFKYSFKNLEYKPYIIASNIEYPAFTEHQHTFITGGSGTGKTVFLSSIIDQIKERGDIAIIYDKMGSFIPFYYEEGKDIILNPYDKRAKNWSIFNEVRIGKEEIDLRNIASSLIPNIKSGDNFWNENARNLFIEISKELRRQNKGNNKDLAEYILRKGFYELRDFLKNSDVKSLFENDEQIRTTLSIKSTLTAYTQFLKILKQDEFVKETDKFSIRNFIQDSINSTKGSFLFLSSRSDMHETLQPLLTCQIDIVINSLLSLKQQKEKNIWVILDELPSINQIPSLDAGLSQSRQFGGSFILSMQLISQLREVYGEKKADTMSGNCKTRIIFSSPDINTAKWSAESLGKKEVDEVKEGLTFGANEIRDGVSISTQKRMEEIVIPSEIQSLPNLSCFIRFPFSFPIIKLKIKPKTRNKIAESLVEDEIKFIEYKEIKKDGLEENLKNIAEVNIDNESSDNCSEPNKKNPIKKNMFEEDN